MRVPIFFTRAFHSDYCSSTDSLAGAVRLVIAITKIHHFYLPQMLRAPVAVLRDPQRGAGAIHEAATEL